jgi:hypothetical protein
LSGKNGMVCSIIYFTKGIGDKLFSTKKYAVSVFQANCSEENTIKIKESVGLMLYP